LTDELGSDFSNLDLAQLEIVRNNDNAASSASVDAGQTNQAGLKSLGRYGLKDLIAETIIIKENDQLQNLTTESWSGLKVKSITIMDNMNLRRIPGNWPGRTSAEVNIQIGWDEAIVDPAKISNNIITNCTLRTDGKGFICEGCDKQTGGAGVAGSAIDFEFCDDLHSCELPGNCNTASPTGEPTKIPTYSPTIALDGAQGLSTAPVLVGILCLFLSFILA
jgi:hypothetical protein